MENILIIFVVLLLSIGTSNAQNWEEINNKAIEFNIKNELKQSIDSAENVLKTIETKFGKNNENYIACLNSLASLFDTLGQVELSAKYYLESLKFTEIIYGKNDIKYLIILDYISEIYYKNELYNEALPYYIESLYLIEKNVGKYHEGYVAYQNKLALLYQYMNQYENALPLYLEALEMTELLNGKNHIYYIRYLNNLASLYQDMKQYEKALPLYLESLENTRINLGVDHKIYGDRLNNLASLYLDMEQYEDALPLYIEAAENTKKNLGVNHSDYGNRLQNLAIIYLKKGEYDKAISISLNSLENIKINYGRSHPKYGLALNNLGLLYQSSGEYKKAMTLFLDALESTGGNLGKNHTEYGVTLYNLASVYKLLGSYDKAIQAILEALDNFESNLGKNHSKYGLALNRMATIFQDMGVYDKALPLFLEALEIFKKTIGKNHSNYGLTLNDLALLYQHQGQYNKALPLFLEAVDNTGKTLGKKHSEYGGRLQNLGNLYLNLGQFEKAIPLFKESLEIFQNTTGTKHFNYGTTINNLAIANLNIGQYDKAIALSLEAKEIFEKSLGKDHPNYGNSLNNLAYLYQNKGDYSTALPFYLEALANTKKTLGENHFMYGIYSNNLALLYESLGENNKALHLILESLKNISWNIEKNFTYLSENEKHYFLRQLEYTFLTYKNFFTRCASTNPEATAHAYNVELISKGLILQSLTRMRNYIMETNKSELIGKFDEWIRLKKILAKKYSQPNSEKNVDVNDIEAKAETLEADLTRLSSTFSEHNKLRKNTWQDVQASLGTNDFAIEVASFPYRSSYHWTDSTLYVALIISHDDEYPMLIPLFEEKQLIDIITKDASKETTRVNNIYKNSSLYQLIWKPMEKYFSPNSNIYWSPSGLLNKINIHAIQNTDSTYLSDIYNISLISTTASVIKSSLEIVEINDVFIFGGMDYETEEQDISKSIVKINKDVDYMSRGLYMPDSTRSGKWSYLPGTKKEAENICNISKDANIPTKLYIGAEAVEEQYKNLDGNKSPSILHIATHGFFFPDPKISKEKLDRMGFHSDNPFTIADNPMNRSGLLFSGSNKAWVGDSISIDGEDGILTAFEASHTYLKNTELVVLSACETGLGDIKGSEGVYGLQRAFKMAGVRYLMMSLWKVPDNATQEFMTTFYTELLTNKKSIRDAYNTTQKQMRDKYRDEPYKWGGFVLME